MLTSSTLTFSMGSGERKRCSNMAQFRLDESAEVARGAVLNAENGMQVIVVLDDHAGTELGCWNRHCWFTSPYSLPGIWAAGQVARASAAHRSNNYSTQRAVVVGMACQCDQIYSRVMPMQSAEDY